MSAGGKERVCAWCGAPFFADKRHKYCSEECADEAHREQARVRFRRRYAENHERELARCRDYYARNTEKKKEYCHDYYARNAETLKARTFERYHRHKEAASNV